MAVPIIPLVAAGAAALYFLTGSKDAKAAEPTAVPPEVLARMGKALASNNPTTIRAEASKLLSEGWQSQAQELLRVAAEIEAGRAKASPVQAVTVKKAAPKPAAKPASKPAPVAAPVTVQPYAAAAASPYTVPPKAEVKILSPLDTVADPTPKARTLVSGNTGADVETWQRQLAAFGYSPILFNGKFDAATVNATKKFQSDSLEIYHDPRITIDGKVGANTRKLVVGRANSKGMKLVAPVQTKPGQAPIAAPAAQAQANAAQATAANALQFSKPAVAPVPVVIAPAPPKAAAAAKLADGTKPLDSVTDPTPNARVLKRGVSDGPDVKGWQETLRRFGYQLGTFGPKKDGVDGNFGGATETATRKFQSDSLTLYKDPRIVVDGQVGPTTRKLVVLRSKNGGAALAGDLRRGVPVSELGRDTGMFLADTPLPGIIDPAVDGTPVDPRRLLAGRVAAHLTEAPIGKEDRTLIARFQAQEAVKPTGLYGPGTAVQIMKYGIAPPWPRAWSQKGRVVTRAKYKAALLAQAEKDPARADEWRGAALEKY